MLMVLFCCGDCLDLMWLVTLVCGRIQLGLIVCGFLFAGGFGGVCCFTVLVGCWLVLVWGGIWFTARVCFVCYGLRVV